MSPRYPGAYWVPTGDAGGMPDGPKVCSLHIAVTRAERSVAGWNQSAKACHAFNGKNGYMEQYADFNRIMYGVLNGNYRAITVESYDGLLIMQNPYREIGLGGVYGDNADDGRWDAGQCERAADLIAFLFVEYGIPIREMPNSSSSEHGTAPHRWGVDPWREQGCELWTGHPGKRCPGDARVEQIPGIVLRASAIANGVLNGDFGFLPAGEVDLATALARGKTTPSKPEPQPKPEYEVITPEDIEAIAQRTAVVILDTPVAGKDSTGLKVSSSLRRAIVLISSAHNGLSRLGARMKRIAAKVGVSTK